MPIVGTSNLPIASRDRAWDGPAAKRRVFEACDGNVACLSRAFLWRNPDADARTQEAYSLGFADIIDGRLHIVPRGIAATAGGRGVGAASIPEEEKDRIRARICTIYDKVRRAHEDWPECPVRPMRNQIALPCAVVGCAEAVLARGWCNKHYKRWRRHGDVEADVRSQASAGEPQAFLADASNADTEKCIMWPFAVNQRGYPVLQIGGRQVKATRALLEMTGRSRASDDMLALHSCDEPGCINPRHLRWGTQAENIQESVKKGRHSSLWQNLRRQSQRDDLRRAAITADASGDGFEGIIAFEDQQTGDERMIAAGALRWENGPWPLVFDRQEMDHSGMVVGTVNLIERRGKEIWGFGALSDSKDPETQAAVLRTKELLEEGAVGVSMRLDDVEVAERDMEKDDPGPEVVTSGRVRHLAVVDTPAFIGAKIALTAAVDATWFSNPAFGGQTRDPQKDGGDHRLVWQEPERPEEEGQFGCPLTITDDGRIFGHVALWGRCHVGYPGTCVRPPKEPAAYRGYLTGERVPGIPTGPLVMRTIHAPDHLSAAAAQIHYDHTGYAVGDLTLGPDAYGIYAAGAIRPDASESDIEILRACALSGDWRPIGGMHRLIGVLAVSAPGFRVARALAASGVLITVGPGCSSCDDVSSLEERVAALERVVEARMLA